MIKNLSRQLNPGGHIKIGVKGSKITSAKGTEFRPPKKLTHFQLVTTQRNDDGDYIVDVDLQNKIKEANTGLVDKDGCLIGIPIRLIYNDVELSFPNRYVSYVSGKMSCTGDGEFSTKRIDDFKQQHKCPCTRLDQGYDGKDKCKISASLICIIDEAGLFGQAHKFSTTSMNSVKGILGGIELIKASTGGRIAGLPLMLTMNPKQTTTPQGIATTIYIVSICYRGSMEDLRNETLRIMSTEKQYLISMDDLEADAKKAICDNGPVLVSDEDEKDFVEEFFPEAVVHDENHGTIDLKNTKIVSQEIKPVVEEHDQGQDKTCDQIIQSQQVESDTENKNETVDPVSGDPETVDPDTDEQSTNQTKTMYEKAIEPVGTYLKIYTSFLAEKDLEKAMKFANRLMSGNLIYWLQQNYCDIDFEPNIKKPELLKLIENILTSTLPEKSLYPIESVNPGSASQEGVAVKCIECTSLLMESDSGLICPNGHNQSTNSTQEQKNDNAGDGAKSEEKPVYPKEWDNSPPITTQKDLLRILVALKVQLESEGVLRPDKWVSHVNYFLDESGQEIGEAVNLTIVQGKTFIRMLACSTKGPIGNAVLDLAEKNGVVLNDIPF